MFESRDLALIQVIAEVVGSNAGHCTSIILQRAALPTEIALFSVQPKITTVSVSLRRDFKPGRTRLARSQFALQLISKI